MSLSAEQHAFSVIADPPTDAASLQEALLLLDACSPALLNSVLRCLSPKQRLRWITAITSFAPQMPQAAVEIVYRVFLLTFPDRDGARHYTTLLESGRITPGDMAHLLAVRRPLSLLRYAPSAFFFHLFGFSRVKIRSGSLRAARHQSGAKSAARNPSSVSAAEPTSEKNQQSPDDRNKDDIEYDSERPSIAIVIHRAGTGFSGGAERLALEYARYLSEIASVEVVTTQARNYLTWKNEFPKGLQNEDGILLRRFPVKNGRHRLFHKLSMLLFRSLSMILAAGSPPSSLQKRPLASVFWKMLSPLALLWMRLQGPHAPDLQAWIKRWNYDFYIFVTYLYETSYASLPIVADRAALVPTAHPEWPLQLPIWQRIFHDRRPGWIFLAEEEHRFLRQWFPEMNDGPVVGCGLASVAQLQSLQRKRGAGLSSFRERFSINGPFVLYTGRIDPEKGCRKLIAYFLAFLRKSNARLTLVLVGTEAMTVPAHPAIVTTGFVDDDTMQAALCECSIYVHPSPYESFSFSLLEAMAAGAPVLVTAESDVLRGHVIRSRAGLYYRDIDDFIEKLTVLLREPQRFQNGPHYVQKRYSHEAVKGSLQRYVLERIGAQ